MAATGSWKHAATGRESLPVLISQGTPCFVGPTAAHSDSEDTAERLKVAFDLFEFGRAVRRQRIVRENPGLSPAEVDEMLVAWLSVRPRAQSGDAQGRPANLTLRRFA